MQKKINILVVGAGAQGAPCVAILARQPGVDRILLGTRALADASAVRDRLGSPKIVVAEFDARQPDAIVHSVRESLGTVDVVIDLTPSFISMHVMQAALALGAHYINTAACPEHLAQLIQGQPLELADRFVTAGRSALLGCGASPGTVNIICRRFCDELETVERIEIRCGFHVPAQKELVKTWTPTWCPEQQYFDYGDPPCLFHGGQHKHMPVFHEPESYDFGENLGEIQLTHHAHDEQYSLPLTIGKGMQYCCYKFPFEPAIATLYATGFTQDRVVEVDGVKVKAVDVLMALVPPPAEIAVLDPQVQKNLVPFIADTRAHILIKGTSGGKEKTCHIVTGAFFDEAAKALELFGTANVAVAYAAATGALQLTEGKTKAGILWPEELDAARFIALSNTLGLTLNFIRTERTRGGRLRKSTPLPACPGCKMIKNEWPGEGYTHDGETYCCQGCAEGAGCTCVTVGKPGFSRKGQKVTKAEPRPGEQRSGAPAPKGELSGERDVFGTAEALDQGG